MVLCYCGAAKTATPPGWKCGGMYSKHAAQGFYSCAENIRITILAANHDGRVLRVLCPQFQISGPAVDAPQHKAVTNADGGNVPILHILTGPDEYQGAGGEVGPHHAVILAAENEIGFDIKDTTDGFEWKLK